MTTTNIAIPELRVSGESLAKRMVDIVGSSALLLLLAPFFLLVAIMIKLDSKGSVFFRQERIGKDGEPFNMWKFRTLRADSHPYQQSPGSNLDPRLTRIGKLLRRYSIDELPQLWNVITGKMSLVGPRPEMPFIVSKYGSLERQRLRVKPGITGLWQISPARAMPIHENLQYDFFYLENQSLKLDCFILLRTFAAVIRGIGAT